MLKSLCIISSLIYSVIGTAYSYDSLHEFKNFIKQYNKTYNSPNEVLKRYTIFSSNLQKIRIHNLMDLSWKMELNEWADLNWNEFKNNRLGLKVFYPKGIQKITPTLGTIPNTVDWRTKGIVNPIKNQEQCGSCWAFSAVGAIESAVALKTGKLFSLSEQQLVDCSGSFGNEGCSGGLMDDAFNYVENNKLCTEDSYTYTAEDGMCKSCKGLVDIHGYVDVQSGNETALKLAVAQQPVSVAIEADQDGFQFYSSGVFDGTCGENLDHGVIIVGYGTENNQDYWLVRNSWGESWGDNGYIKLIRGKNQCGISLQPSYPVV
jgi:C1A family cysteine protease